MTICDGWEKLPHEVDKAADLRSVGSHTHLCPECFAKLDKDPMKNELLRYL